MLDAIKKWAASLKLELVALYLAARDPRTPWPARCLTVLVTIYALSPIDLIPDFIPIIGYVDDLILVPVGIWLVVHLIPADMMAQFRRAARDRASLPASRTGAAIIILVWLLAILALAAPYIAKL
jgi:uncharacterized membrane protein YkvA (DUF1232 family)